MGSVKSCGQIITAFLTATFLVSELAHAADPIFTDVTDIVATNLPQVGGGVSWVDFDSNGRLDFLLGGSTVGVTHNPDGSGSTFPIYVAPLWRNTGGGFTNVFS